MAKDDLLEQLRDRFESEFPQYRQPRLIDLYHYTNADGLKGIIESRKLWATHYRHVNDFAEFDYGRQIGIEIIQALKSTCRHIIVDRMYADVLSLIDAERTEIHYFVACFCGQDDLLSQWRGYGDSGMGYSIHLKPMTQTIDLLQLVQIRKTSSGGEIVDLDYLWVKLDYDRHEQCIKDLVQLAQRHVEDMCLEIDPDADYNQSVLNTRTMSSDTLNRCYEVAFEAASYLFEQLMQTFIRMKSPGFRQEFEWRIVLIDWEQNSAIFDKKFRVSKGNLVPYVETSFLEVNEIRLFDIESIRCGPSRHPEGAVNAVKLLLLKHGFPHTQVNRSEIPLKV